MRRPIRTYIEQDLHDRYAARFGGYGAISYVVEVAMSELLDATEGQPDLEEIVRQAIRTYVLKRKLESSNASENSGLIAE